MDVASRSGLVEGQFKGRTIRFRLELAQEPTTGRKSGEKDRRPLANVPIVRVIIIETYPDGREVRMDENTIDPTTLFCSVDLCSPMSSMTPLSSGGQPGPSSQASTFASANQPFSYPNPISSSPAGTPTPENFRNTFPFPATQPVAQRRNHARIPVSGRGGAASSTAGSSSTTSGSGSQGTSSGASGNSSGTGSTTGSGSGGGSSGSAGSWETVASKGKTVRNIFGNLIAPCVCLVDLDNIPGLWFIFQDIAIRTEGTYSLRFSLFDLETRTADSLNHAPILAECFSSPLTIYAPRNHPGVPPSTKLAKHFVSQGYRLSLKKGGVSGSQSSSSNSSKPATTKPYSSSSKVRKRASSSGDNTEIADEDEDEDEDDDEDAVGEDDDGASE